MNLLGFFRKTECGLLSNCESNKCVIVPSLIERAAPVAVKLSCMCGSESNIANGPLQVTEDPTSGVLQFKYQDPFSCEYTSEIFVFRNGDGTTRVTAKKAPAVRHRAAAATCANLSQRTVAAVSLQIKIIESFNKFFFRFFANLFFFLMSGLSE